MRTGILLAAITFFAIGVSSAAIQGTVHSITLPTIPTELKAGTGKEKAETYCSICHSLDYIPLQPKVSKTQWAATVNKMIKVMGAPINEEDAKTIITYLAAQYGTGD